LEDAIIFNPDQINYVETELLDEMVLSSFIAISFILIYSCLEPIYVFCVGDNVVIYCSVSRVVKYMQLLGADIVISEQKLTKG
jgi:hypothetical protein